MNQREINKLDKRNRLIASALDLFIINGVTKTSIDQIVKKANVGKGTFYLYFRDKDAISDAVILQASNDLFKYAAITTKKYAAPNITERLINMLDLIIDVFKEYPYIVKIFRTSLTWKFIENAIANPTNEKVYHLINDFFNYLLTFGYTNDEAFQLFFMILELVCSMSYTSLIMGVPSDIDKLKPILFNSIRAMIQQGPPNKKNSI
ncbi:MAG: TetR/AcrR family transcriptional regulator [Erysipelotrichaceae bacterium]